MLTNANTDSKARTTVLEEIESLLLEDNDEPVTLTGSETMAELALNSLSLARLIILLESSFGVDPFTSGDKAVSDMRSVNDLVAAYEDAVHSGGRTGDDRAGV